MITARLPVWRTNPAGFAHSGGLRLARWPVVTGSLAVVLGGPILGRGLWTVNEALFVPGSTAYSATAMAAATLIGSFLFSWILLLVLIPISNYLARTGRAGWGVAAIVGFYTGYFTGFLTKVGTDIELRDISSPATDLPIAIAGLLLGLIYWATIRMLHRAVIGIPATQPTPLATP